MLGLFEGGSLRGWGGKGGAEGKGVGWLGGEGVGGGGEGGGWWGGWWVVGGWSNEYY